MNSAGWEIDWEASAAEPTSVRVAAAARGYRRLPAELNGVPVRLFPARTLLPGMGFPGMGAPALTKWFRNSAADFDVVHIHFGRDLVVLPVAVAARRRHDDHPVRVMALIRGNHTGRHSRHRQCAEQVRSQPGKPPHAAIQPSP